MSEEIIKEYQGELLAFIRRKVKDYDVSMDILQDVLVKIHFAYERLEKKESLKSWMYKITSNAIMDHFRKKKNMVEPLTENLKQEEKYVEDAEENMAACVKPFVNQLPKPYKEALLQTDLGGKSQKEYAASNGLSYSGVKSTVQRARLKLRNLFDACCEVKADKYGQVMEYQPRKGCSCP
jgi:RNA polymerase sigma-70 factor, ECF subfamily